MVGKRVISYYRLECCPLLDLHKQYRFFSFWTSVDIQYLSCWQAFVHLSARKKSSRIGRVLFIHSTYTNGLWRGWFLSYRWNPVGQFFCAGEKMVSWRYTTRKVDGATPQKVAICFLGHDKPRLMGVEIAIYLHYGVDPRSYYLSLVVFLYVFHCFFHDNKKRHLSRSPYWVVVP